MGHGFRQVLTFNYSASNLTADMISMVHLYQQMGPSSMFAADDVQRGTVRSNAGVLYQLSYGRGTATGHWTR